MKPDISSREDINIVIVKFYNKLISDENMFPFFKEIIEHNHLNEHLEIITTFWEDILLDSYKYKNNAMQKHIDFAKKTPFSKHHFATWLNYFQNTIDEFFDGQVAHEMKTRAQSIAMIMQLKMNLYNN